MRDRRIPGVTHRQGTNAESERASTGRKRKRLAENGDELPVGPPEVTICDEAAEGCDGRHNTTSVPPGVVSAGLKGLSGVQRRKRRRRGATVSKDSAGLQGDGQSHVSRTFSGKLESVDREASLNASLTCS